MTKLIDIPAANVADDGGVLYLVQGGQDRRATVAQVRAIPVLAGQETPIASALLSKADKSDTLTRSQSIQVFDAGGNNAAFRPAAALVYWRGVDDEPDNAQAGDFWWDGTAWTAVATTTNIAPVALTAPSISPANPQPGDIVTITPGTYSGTPEPTVEYTLILDGDDVTGDMDGLSYEVPGGSVDGEGLTWTEVAQNAAGTVSQSASATVRVPEVSDLAMILTSIGELQVENVGDGALLLTIEEPPEYAGEYTITPTDLDSGPVCLVPPVIAGVGQVGNTLTKTVGGLWAYKGATFSRSQVWIADGSAIDGATADDLTLNVGQAGATVAMREIGTNEHGPRSQDSNVISVAASGALYQDNFDAYSLDEDIPTSSPNWEVMASRFNGKMVGDGTGQARLGFGTAVNSRIFVNHVGDLAADQFARVTYVDHTAETLLNVCVRMTPNSSIWADGYAFQIEPYRDVMRLVRRFGGVATDLAAGNVSVSPGDVLEIRAIGSALSAYVNGVLQMSATDSSIVGGKAGLFIFGPQAGDYATIDNFIGGEL